MYINLRELGEKSMENGRISSLSQDLLNHYVNELFQKFNIKTKIKVWCGVIENRVLANSSVVDSLQLDVSVKINGNDFKFTILNSGYLICDFDRNLIGAANEHKRSDDFKNIHDDYIIPELSKAIVLVNDADNKPVIDSEILISSIENSFIRNDNDYSIYSIDKILYVYPVHSVLKISFVPVENNKEFVL